MKKIVVIVCAALVMAGLLGCGSTKGVLPGADQREAAGRPRWAGAGISFYTADAGLYGVQPLSESGLYACGMSDQLAEAANLDARTQLARFIGAEMVAAERRKIATGGQSEFKQIEESMVSNHLSGSMIVDTFTDTGTGAMYSLAFISDANLRKSFSTTDYSDLAEAVIRNWETAAK